MSKLELCNKIKEYQKNFEICLNEFGKDLDKRDYIVSNDKIEARGYQPEYSLDHGIIELIKLFKFLKVNLNMYISYIERNNIKKCDTEFYELLHLEDLK